MTEIRGSFSGINVGIKSLVVRWDSKSHLTNWIGRTNLKKCVQKSSSNLKATEQDYLRMYVCT